MNLKIKKMSNEDIPFVFHVFEQSRSVLHGNYISLEEWTKYFANLDISGGDPYESHHIVTANDTPAAWLKINGWNKPEICISMLVVDDLFKHKGVGQFAMQFAEKEARYWGKSAIRVQTTRDNAVATECYLKCGYEIMGEMMYRVGDGVEREGYEFKKSILPEALTEETLTKVLSKMLGVKIINADFQAAQMHGGTVGDIRLVAGTAETIDGDKLPYKVVLKVQKKWERQGDPGSWRREYDLYMSDLSGIFSDSDSFRWAKYCHAEMNSDETETQIWIEYIDGVSGYELTVEMLEQASLELGRFQGRLYKEKPRLLQNISCFTQIEQVKDYYTTYRTQSKEYDYICAQDCEIPGHLRQMLIDIDDETEAIYDNIDNIPVVLCHRDFWVENIICSDGKIILLDWDCTGWGYVCEDIIQLITDEVDTKYLEEYYRRFIPAYLRGFSEYADISRINSLYIWKLFVIKFGYAMAHWHMSAKSPDEKAQSVEILQRIYEMRDIQFGLGYN